MNKVPQGWRGSGSGVEEGGDGREEEDCRRVEDVPKGKDVKGPGEGEQVIHVNGSIEELSQTEKEAEPTSKKERAWPFSVGDRVPQKAWNRLL